MQDHAHEASHLPTTLTRSGEPERDAQYVTWRLEEAGRTLLCLPMTGYSTRLRSSALDIVRGAAEAYGLSEKRLRPPVPSGAAIDRMDEAYGWLRLIPEEKFVIRRIVGARSLVHPLTDRHLYPWRRLAAAVGADHKAVQRWWAQGIDRIVAGLGARIPPAPRAVYTASSIARNVP